MAILDEEAVDKLTEFERRAHAADVDPRELWPTFPFDEVAATVENTLGIGIGHAVRELAAVGADRAPRSRSMTWCCAEPRRERLRSAA